TYNIIRDNWAFDFATRYASQHATVPSPADFVVTDSIFNEFKQFIDPDKFKYDRACESVLTALREAAETEGYMNDSVKAQIDILDGMLKHNLDHDLNQNRPIIEAILAGEIMKRYYYQRGTAQNLLRYDAAVDSAVNILSDPAVMTREPFSYWK
ncbi:MAG: peptidase S41, partial [Muribaculaceae bacterium]|nr:peptidase S41 [Muribaculaceae bacterium]